MNRFFNRKGDSMNRYESDAQPIVITNAVKAQLREYEKPRCVPIKSLGQPQTEKMVDV